jgi:DNA-binding transcriptional MerR regulator
LPKASSNSRSKTTDRKKKAPRSARKVGEALKVGAVAERLGVSASMVRSWEKLGLANPVRSQSKYRLYTNDDLRVLRRAIYLRRVQGLNAPAILNQLKQEGLLNHRAAGPAEEQSSIGPRFRKLRLQRGESLATVANAVGVSIGFLSNLERSQSGASISIMRKLAQYYGLNILDLFNPIDGTGPLVRPRDRKSLEGGPGVHMELLASGKITMEPHLFRLARERAAANPTRTKARSFCIWCVAGWTSSWRARNSSCGRATASISAARPSIAGPIPARPRR